VADDSEIDNSHHFIFGSNRSLRVKILLLVAGVRIGFGFSS